MSRPSLFKEFLLFLMDNKKWWMLPILIVFALLGLLIFAAQVCAPAAPFIYTLF